MLDASDRFDSNSQTDLWQSEISLNACGRNRFLFGLPFRPRRHCNSPYSLLRNDTSNSGILESIFTTVSDTSLGQKNSKWKENTMPDIKYPKFIPIYDTNKRSCEKISLNSSHPVPWFDIEASCIKMEQNNSIADLSRYLAEGKLYAVNDISKKEIKKLESRSNTSVNLDEAYTDEDVMNMYRKMQEIRKERKKLTKTKDYKLRPSSSSSSLSSSEISFDGCIDEKSCIEISRPWYSGREGVSLWDESSSVDGDLQNTSRSFSLSVNEITHKIPKPSPLRFGDANERHCEAVSNLVKKRLFISRRGNAENDPVVDLYVEMTDGRIRSLCHIKAGMANLCLNTFFFPCTNVASVSWVSNIQEAIIRKLLKIFNPLKDVFGKHVSRLSVGEFKAVLFLSKGAKDIIKHRDLCMLDTLLVALGIPRGSLLLLDMDKKPTDLM